MSKQKDQLIRRLEAKVESLLRQNENLINKTHIQHRELEVIKERAGLSEEEMNEIHKEVLREFR